ncbi:MAG: hypothetical protein ABR569_13165 [Gaiellaceae bacterium]
MLAVTESAANAIREIAETTGLPGDGGGLRFSLTEVDEDEAQLQVALVRTARDGDEVVEEAGATVYLDADAAAILDDQVLDAQVKADGEVGFSLEDVSYARRRPADLRARSKLNRVRSIKEWSRSHRN